MYALGVPVLGICYGMQTMAKQLGGRVAASAEREFGYAEVTVSAACRLLDDLQDRRDRKGNAVLDVWMSHGDHVDAIPQGFTVTAATDAIPFAAMADERRRFYGVQFHPEVTHTPQGAKLLERFVREICGCRALWSVGNIIDDAIARVRAAVGEGRVLLGLSGGSIHPSSQRCCIAPSALSSCACSLITASCAWARAMRSCAPLPITWACV